jgi:hypothetical protein
MPDPRRKAALLVVPWAILCLILASAPSPIPGSGDPWERLRSMSPELRGHLFGQLKALDLLPRAEKDAVRDLDRRIGQESDEERSADFAILRRYHLWYQGLPEAQRLQLAAAPADARLALVKKFRAERTATPSPVGVVSRYGDFAGGTPFTVARQLKAWFKLDDKARADLEALQVGDRARKLNALAAKLDDKEGVGHLNDSEVDRLCQEAIATHRYPYLRRLAQAKKGSDPVRRRFAENYYFEAHPPRPVNPEVLYTFSKSLPSWVTDYSLTLAPDEARHRLTILYRLIHGDKDPAPPARTRSTGPSTPAPSPGPRPPTPPAPKSTTSPY